MINGYLIDPEARKITRIELPGDSRGNLDAMYAAIGCDLVEVVYFNHDSRDGVFVDEEGMIKGPVKNFFYIEGFHQPLAGKGVVLGCDDEGNSISPQVVTLDWLRDNVAFVERIAPHAISVASPRLEMTMKVKSFFI